MRAHRINIIGASGSGTSTVGRALSAELSIPHFESDDYFHEPTDPPFSKQRDPQERYALIIADLNRHTSWILSGGVTGWEPYPQLEFTLIVFLWVPTPIRIARLLRREHGRFGDRIDKGGDMYSTHEEFLAWAARYDIGDIEGKTLARHEAYLAAQTCPVLQLRGEIKTDVTTNEISAALG